MINLSISNYYPKIYAISDFNPGARYKNIDYVRLPGKIDIYLRYYNIIPIRKILIEEKSTTTSNIRQS